jgi:glycosyltransferase involved in cell wall biosynthesis
VLDDIDISVDRLGSCGRVNERPRILVFAEAGLSVSETFIANHCRFLTRFNPVLVTLDGNGAANIADIPSVAVTPGGRAASKLERAIFRIGVDRRLDDIILHLRPSVIHAHYIINGAFMLPYARRFGVPLVATIHGYDITRLSKKLSLNAQIFKLRKRGMRNADVHILASSEYLRQRALDVGFSADNMSVHYLGIPIPALAQIPIAKKPLRIVFAGRLVEKKGLDRVTAAFQKLRAQIPNVELHVVGDGPLRGMVEATKSKVGGVKLYGAMPNAEVLEIMRSARVFTMPSREASDGDAEGFGLTLIEAQALGVPVVTSTRTGTRETVQDGVTGYLVDPNDVDGLANAYVRLLQDDKLCADMGSRARLWVEQNFDIQSRTRILEDLYDRLVTNSAAAADRT